LISALKIDASQFFESIEIKEGVKYIHVAKEDQEYIEKEQGAKGFTYQHIFDKSLSAVGFQAVLLTIAPNSERDKVITDAWEFKYMLSGTCSYIIDDEEVIVKEGDSLYFNGRLPHVPINKSDANCTMLVLYFYSDNN